MGCALSTMDAPVHCPPLVPGNLGVQDEEDTLVVVAPCAHAESVVRLQRMQPPLCMREALCCLAIKQGHWLMHAAQGTPSHAQPSVIAWSPAAAGVRVAATKGSGLSAVGMSPKALSHCAQAATLCVCHPHTANG